MGFFFFAFAWTSSSILFFGLCFGSAIHSACINFIVQENVIRPYPPPLSLSFFCSNFSQYWPGHYRTVQRMSNSKRPIPNIKIITIFTFEFGHCKTTMKEIFAYLALGFTISPLNNKIPIFLPNWIWVVLLFLSCHFGMIHMRHSHNKFTYDFATMREAIIN